MMRGFGSLTGRPQTAGGVAGPIEGVQKVLKVLPVNAVDSSLSFANTSMKCRPRIHWRLMTAPRWACATKADSWGRGPGYGSHIARVVSGWLLGPGAP